LAAQISEERGAFGAKRATSESNPPILAAAQISEERGAVGTVALDEIARSSELGGSSR
jgi:hypothetical protein